MPVSINQMEQLLLNLPRLKYFEISGKGSFDLTNGYLWERLTHQLITFNFNFCLKIYEIEEILNSFRTSFWIERKKWFVVATRERLFSVSHFSENIANGYFQLPLHTTIPHADKTLLFDKVNYFILNDSFIFHQNYLRYVKTLEIQKAGLLEYLPTLIDLNHVENLILSSSSSMNRLTVLSLMNSMSSLQQFSINTELENFLDQTENVCFKQIRVLEINYPIVDGKFYIIEQLVRLFPNIEILRVNSIRWKLGIACLLDKFENLRSASFRFEKSSTSETDTNVLNFIRNKIQYQKYEEFRYRCRSNSTTGQNQGEYYDFWIKKQVSSFSCNIPIDVFFSLSRNSNPCRITIGCQNEDTTIIVSTITWKTVSFFKYYFLLYSIQNCIFHGLITFVARQANRIVDLCRYYLCM